MPAVRGRSERGVARVPGAGAYPPCDHDGMLVRAVHDRDELAALLGRDPARYAYQLGDLDDHFWPYTSWYRHRDALALLYHGIDPPTLLAIGAPADEPHLVELAEGLLPLLPRRFYAHLNAVVEPVLSREFRADSHGPHLKMALTERARLALAEPAGDVLSATDLPELTTLYAAAYPGNWFDERMLAAGPYVGVRHHGELVAVAGVHVWSPTRRVAALGNVATHPRVRGQGFARRAVAALCRRLLETVDHVALNVKADNLPARALYDRLGFTPTAEYTEYVFTARR